ncbi:hypothetical protein NE237_001749 [Protea cynaroides]|uniref:Glutamine amidotransferase type-2 domain-containing protein n=1 Tax=Protea cynaroides TaxID=273540 RepID=A0A9Q0KTQ1_9MAGN|nr:hypothetical protein NE237_001749 [Protea cynaroides]
MSSEEITAVQKLLIAVHDPYGFRPLVMGRRSNDSIVFASETCALDLIKATCAREVNLGEALVVDKSRVQSLCLLVVGFWFLWRRHKKQRKKKRLVKVVLELGILNIGGLHPMKTRDGKSSSNTYYGYKWEAVIIEVAKTLTNSQIFSIPDRLDATSATASGGANSSSPPSSLEVGISCGIFPLFLTRRWKILDEGQGDHGHSIDKTNLQILKGFSNPTAWQM